MAMAAGVIDRDWDASYIALLGAGSTSREAWAGQVEGGVMFKRVLTAVLFGLPLLLIVAAVGFYIVLSYQCPHGITGEPGCMLP